MRFKNISTRSVRWLNIAIVGILLGVSIQFASAAWTPAPANPPAGNVLGPITTVGNQTIYGPLDILGAINGITFGRGPGGDGIGSGGENVAIGIDALVNNTTGSSDVAIGVNALGSNTSGQANIGIGNSALHGNTSGVDNIAVGIGAMQSLTSGFDNTAIGGFAMGFNTSGDNNTAIGSYTSIANGVSNATAIGFGATASASNATAIGANALAWSANSIILGDGFANVGINSVNPQAKLTVGGTGASNMSIYGRNDAGIGMYGVSLAGGTGISGNSTSGTGVYARTDGNGSSALYAINNGTASSYAGYFVGNVKVNGDLKVTYKENIVHGGLGTVMPASIQCSAFTLVPDTVKLVPATKVLALRYVPAPANFPECGSASAEAFYDGYTSTCNFISNATEFCVNTNYGG